MSAECDKCGHDLGYHFECVFCGLHSELSDLRAKSERLRRAVWNLDLSDKWTLEQAKSGELVSCTRPVELWIELRAALSALKEES